MGTLYLVRHGQASLGSDNYDQLSELGKRQSIRLGEYFALTGIRFDTVLTGTLQRHAQTLSGIAHGLGLESSSETDKLLPNLRPELNEYDSHAIVQCIHPHKQEKPASKDQIQSYFRILKEGLHQWMQGTIQPQGMPSYEDFEKGIVKVLNEIRQSEHQKILMVSSGGPISTAIGYVLGVPHTARVALNLQIRNSSVSEIQFSNKNQTLHTYNTLPHLDTIAHKEWITYA